MRRWLPSDRRPWSAALPDFEAIAAPCLLVAAITACAQDPPPGADAAAKAPPAASAAIPEASAPEASAPAASASANPLGIREARAEAVHVAAPAPGAPCAAAPGITLLSSPRTPLGGGPLRWVAVSEAPLEGVLVVRGPGGAEVKRSAERHGGSPYFWLVEVPAASPGAYRADLVPTGDTGARACAEVSVVAERPPQPAPRRGGQVWAVTADWTRGTEALYSAWIEKLFDDPLDVQPSWPALHEVLRDPKRNFLHDHLGLDEDRSGPGALVLDPDCADLPFFLRGYFAYKLGLPFGYSACSRGGPGGPPRCSRWHSNLSARPRGRGLSAFGAFLRIAVADTVHSGVGRTSATDDDTDFYPVPLTAESLRPGTVYADPYGHMLVVVKRVSQTEERAGLLLAVDGQPDSTVARRRFWRGNFLFADDPILGSPGFKHHRPVVRAGRGLRPLKNEEIAQSGEYGDYSLEQYKLGVDGFYDKMEDVLSPAPLDPARAMRETLQALEEQVKSRVLSVQNGVSYLSRGGETIEMPEGSAIFETTGPWEDFSTPSRDLRLLIAIDIVKTFPDRVARRPERYAMPGGKSGAEMKAELATILQRELDARRVTYQRSDGSPFTLSLADVVARSEALEMAYNPNDCPEIRWGAALGSDEAKTCRRRAPGDQRGRMARYRAWFHERRRPPRGS